MRSKYQNTSPNAPSLTKHNSSWGRILAASGSLQSLSKPLIPSRVSVSFIPTDGSPILPLLINGEPEKVNEERAKQILLNEDLEIRVELGLGNESAKYWTCDFSYVRYRFSLYNNIEGDLTWLAILT